MSDFDVLLIDGRSGSGKTSRADSLAADLRAAGCSLQILRVEDLYPGWDGLAEGSRAVADALDSGRYRRYDWLSGSFAEEVRIEPLVPLIIEGCGALTRANLAAAKRWAARAVAAQHDADVVCGQDPAPRVRGIWIELPEPERRARALARDGDTFALHWERWAAQEDAHFGLHRPWELAPLVGGAAQSG